MFTKSNYVVYNGQVGGVYKYWIDCYAQASGYQDCVVRLHDTLQEGVDAWSAFSNSCTINSNSTLFIF